jgi:hypothetical protein
METIRYLLLVFIKAAAAFFLAAAVWWLVTLLYPSLSLRSLITHSVGTSGKSAATDWLPSPKQYKNIFGKTPAPESQVYVPAAPFSGYTINNPTTATANGYTYSSANYITYTASGSAVVTADGTPVKEAVSAVDQNPSVGNALDSVFSVRSLYIRNLSIYESGHVYTGLSFIGEARANMFRDGKFPIIIFDRSGRAVGVSAAVATTDWSVPGWVRFETRIPYTLPNTMPCTMVFEEALTAQERVGHNPIRVSMEVKCN